jgi:ribonucleoside-triphosphate reductase
MTSNALPTDYQHFIATSRYARWLDEEGRRETWSETVSRYVDYMAERTGLDTDTTEEIWDAIHNLDVMPSMRALMTAGKALDRDNTAGYNCSYLPVDDPKSFDEAMYILLCGTGVGFSVERQYIDRLPEVPEKLFDSHTTIVVSDSKEGWAKAFRQLVALLYAGEIVVVGGVRRSAMISLSNLSDIRMRHAKTGQWWETAPHMALSNNSVAYTDKPDSETFLREWTSLVESKSGERGIFNRVSAQKQAAKNGRRNPDHEFGTNPCSEIILRPHQFCNLTEVVVKEKDTDEDLIRKVRLATILGTAQSTLTKFPYLRKIWQHNTQEERLLGVSLTGIMDNMLTNGLLVNMDKRLPNLKQVAIDTNKEYAEKFNIEPSTAITCVKPSGTVSQLCDSASGIHARHSQYYIRTVRGDNKDPLTKFMIDQGVPSEPCVMKPDTTTVFSFPMKSPERSRMRDSMSALEQLRVWLIYQEHWCEHKPSITVTVKEDEWFDVGAFVFKNFDKMSGVSFLPHSDHVYQQAPYQECTEEEYNDMISKTTKRIDWAKLKDFEKGDTTSGSQTMACSGDSCEIVDIGA